MNYLFLFDEKALKSNIYFKTVLCFHNHVNRLPFSTWKTKEHESNLTYISDTYFIYFIIYNYCIWWEFLASMQLQFIVKLDCYTHCNCKCYHHFMSISTILISKWVISIPFQGQFSIKNFGCYCQYEKAWVFIV